MQLIASFLAQYGYFDLTIDSSHVSLPFRYTVTAVSTAQNNIADAKVIGYSFPTFQTAITYLDEEHTEVQSSVATDVTSSVMRVYVTWDDNAATQTLNDVQDTAIATSSEKAQMQVTVLFEQLVN